MKNNLLFDTAIFLEKVTDCFYAAKENKWWDNDMKKIDDDWANLSEIIDNKTNLIASEAMEMFECMRNGSYAKPKSDIYLDYENMATDLYASLFKEHVKDTYEDELADVYIRVCDLVGFLLYFELAREAKTPLLEYDPRSKTKFLSDIKGLCKKGESFLESIILPIQPTEETIVGSIFKDFLFCCLDSSRRLTDYFLVDIVDGVPESKDVLYYCSILFPHLLVFVEHKEVNLNYHVKAKLAYNTTRGAKHGGKKF